MSLYRSHRNKKILSDLCPITDIYIYTYMEIQREAERATCKNSLILRISRLLEKNELSIVFRIFLTRDIWPSIITLSSYPFHFFSLNVL
jgi:hypothetical protein